MCIAVLYTNTMSQNDLIQIAVDNETENYAVYESADEDTIVGFYVAEGAAENIGEFGALDVSLEGEGVTAELQKETQNYGVYAAEPTVTGMYISHEVLGSDEEDADAPEEIGITITPSDEQAFEEAVGPAQDEEQEAALVADADDTEGKAEPEPEEQEQELVSDEEIGIADD